MNIYSPKILVTGCNGQMGKALQYRADANKFQIIPCTHSMMEITDINSIEANINKYIPDIIINAAAYNSVDLAEQEIHACFNTNYNGAQNLAITCEKYQLPLIHLSTNYIFDGKKTTPYTENDLAQPINMYGKSKLLGENAIRTHCKHHLIIRISAIFSAYGDNFLKTIFQRITEQNELRVVSDQHTCPTFAEDIADSIFSIIEQHPTHWGTYHYCSARAISWYEFAEEIFKIGNLTSHGKTLKAITTDELASIAIRPAYSVLDCNKIKTDFGISQSLWENKLEKIIRTLMQ